MSLSVRITKVTPLYPKSVFLQWDLIDPTESGTYNFLLERSGSVEGPWTVIEPNLPNTFNYVDDFTKPDDQKDDGRINLLSLQRQIYYRVTATPPSGCDNDATSDPHGLENELSPIQAGLRRKLRYEEGILWRRINGTKLALLKRKHWGERCTDDCYDTLTRTVVKEHCPVCFGTGFVGGYWNPVVVYGRIHPPDNIVAQTTQRDKQESSNHHISVPDIPLMQDNDIVVELVTNTRHIIRRKSQTEIARHHVHQQLTTSVLAHSSVEYEILVDATTTPPLL
jgi:hypothetical protein